MLKENSVLNLHAILLQFKPGTTIKVAKLVILYVESKNKKRIFSYHHHQQSTNFNVKPCERLSRLYFDNLIEQQRHKDEKRRKVDQPKAHQYK